MNNDIFYIVETKPSKCNCCGKRIKNIYHFNGKEEIEKVKTMISKLK